KRAPRDNAERRPDAGRTRYVGGARVLYCEGAVDRAIDRYAAEAGGGGGRHAEVRLSDSTRRGRARAFVAGGVDGGDAGDVCRTRAETGDARGDGLAGRGRRSGR